MDEIPSLDNVRTCVVDENVIRTAEYDILRSGKHVVVCVESLADLRGR